MTFLPEDEQKFFDNCVHGLRSRGWSRLDAEGEAMDRLEAARQLAKAKLPNPPVT